MRERCTENKSESDIEKHRESGRFIFSHKASKQCFCFILIVWFVVGLCAYWYPVKIKLNKSTATTNLIFGHFKYYFGFYVISAKYDKIIKWFYGLIYTHYLIYGFWLPISSIF